MINLLFGLLCFETCVFIIFIWAVYSSNKLREQMDKTKKGLLVKQINKIVLDLEDWQWNLPWFPTPEEVKEVVMNRLKYFTDN